MTRRSPLIVFCLGLAALYLGERTLVGNARLVADGLGAALLLATLAFATLRLAREWHAGRENRKAAAAGLGTYGLALVGVLLYALMQALPADSTHVRPLLAVVWPFVLLLGFGPALAIEQALASMAETPQLELWRVKLARRAARIVVLTLVVFAGVNYAAAEWNRKLDLSYFRITEPSAPTLALTEGLTEPVRILMFFAPGNDVAQATRAYLDVLAAKSANIRLELVDQANEPELAKERKVRNNGAIVFERGSQRETLQVGLDMEEARGVLRRFDREVQERLIRVSRPSRVVYFSSGHMERDFAPSGSDKRAGLADLKVLLESSGFAVKRLGLGEGLGATVPTDAGIVVVAGPIEPFLPIEVAAIRAYLERGGRLLALIDPDNGSCEDELLAPLGVKVSNALVATDRQLVRLEGRAESPYDFATTRASAHPATTTMNQYGGRMSVVVLGAGALSKRKDSPAGLKQTPILYSMAEAWEDKNKNRAFDAESEKREARELAYAVEKSTAAAPSVAAATTPSLRAIVIGDADVAGNGLIRNAGNAYLLLDGIKWLAGDEALAGEIASEEDVPLVYNKDNDAVWFYGTSFIVPAGVLAFGLFFTGRRSRRKAG